MKAVELQPREARNAREHPSLALENWYKNDPWNYCLLQCHNWSIPLGCSDKSASLQWSRWPPPSLHFIQIKTFTHSQVPSFESLARPVQRVSTVMTSSILVRQQRFFDPESNQFGTTTKRMMLSLACPYLLGKQSLFLSSLPFSLQCSLTYGITALTGLLFDVLFAYIRACILNTRATKAWLYASISSRNIPSCWATNPHFSYVLFH